MNPNYLRAIIYGTMTLYCGDDTQMGVCVIAGRGRLDNEICKPLTVII